MACSQRSVNRICSAKHRIWEGYLVGSMPPLVALPPLVHSTSKAWSVLCISSASLPSHTCVPGNQKVLCITGTTLNQKIKGCSYKFLIWFCWLSVTTITTACYRMYRFRHVPDDANLEHVVTEVTGCSLFAVYMPTPTNFYSAIIGAISKKFSGL